MAITSFNLWVIKIIVLPCPFKELNILNNSSTSWGVKTAVGSSNISISAPLYSTFIISTLCCMPTETSSILAHGSILKPYLSESSLISLAAFFKLIKKWFFLGSMPRITFSTTVKGGTNMKC